MTPELLARCCHASLERSSLFAAPLTVTARAYDIKTKRRLAFWLANIAQESGRLVYTAEVWGPTPDQQRYQGRIDLGNIHMGDGSKFRGHGLLQTTGAYNHAKVRDRLRLKFPELDVPDFEVDPRALELPQWAALSAGDYVEMRALNSVADADNFELYVRRINGAIRPSTHYPERLEFLRLCNLALSDDAATFESQL